MVILTCAVCWKFGVQILLLMMNDEFELCRSRKSLRRQVADKAPIRLEACIHGGIVPISDGLCRAERCCAAFMLVASRSDEARNGGGSDSREGKPLQQKPVGDLCSCIARAGGRRDAGTLLNPDKEPQNWLMNHRTYDGQRYSPLAPIRFT
jgi:hypothetical protein